MESIFFPLFPIKNQDTFVKYKIEHHLSIQIISKRKDDIHLNRLEHKILSFFKLYKFFRKVYRLSCPFTFPTVGKKRKEKMPLKYNKIFSYGERPVPLVYYYEVIQTDKKFVNCNIITMSLIYIEALFSVQLKPKHLCTTNQQLQNLKSWRKMKTKNLLNSIPILPIFN